MSNTVTYRDPNGDIRVGYIVNGKTYTDAAGTNRVKTGSTVYTNDGKVWEFTASGSKDVTQKYTPQGSQNTVVSGINNGLNNPYASMLSQMQEYLGNQYKNQLKAHNESLDSTIAGLQAQKQNIMKARDEQLRDAYIANQISLSKMPQTQRAIGNTGGLSESSLLASRANYENNRNNIYQNAHNNLNSVDTAVNQARAQGSIGASDIASNYYSNLMNLYSEIAAQDLAARQAAKQEQDAKDLAAAQLMAQVGDYTGLKNYYGLTDAQVDQLTAATAPTVSSSYRGSVSETGVSDTPESSVYDTLYRMGISNEGEAYLGLLNMGYNNTEAGKIAGYYMSMLEDGSFGNNMGNLSIVDYALDRYIQGNPTESDIKLLTAAGYITR